MKLKSRKISTWTAIWFCSSPTQHNIVILCAGLVTTPLDLPPPSPVGKWIPIKKSFVRKIFCCRVCVCVVHGVWGSLEGCGWYNNYTTLPHTSVFQLITFVLAGAKRHLQKHTITICKVRSYVLFLQTYQNNHFNVNTNATLLLHGE